MEPFGRLQRESDVTTDAPMGSHRVSNDEIVAPITTDDERDRAVQALFVAHYDNLRRLAFLLLGDAGHSEEVVMEAFAKALSGWRVFRSVEGSAVYLRRMVINGCHSKHRRRKLDANTLHIFHRRVDSPSQWEADVSASSLAIWAAVKQLPMRQRTCIVLRYLDDLPEAEIASLMDVPIGTVKSQLSRARKKLAEALGPEFLGREDA
jgi:RNA polymerase sigma factor (sigma-70 family)